MIKAARQLKKLAKKHQDSYPSIERAIDSLQDYPNVQGVKALKNYDYRLRVGNYRILFDVHDTIRVIDVQEVKKRDENTY